MPQIGKRPFITLIGLTILTAAQVFASPPDSYQQTVFPILQSYCIECHGEKKQKGGVDFTAMPTLESAFKEFKTWERVVEVMHEREMPPDAARQPPTQDIEEIKAWYKQVFVNQVTPHPGYHQPRRLSAREYRNTLGSVMGFDLKVEIIEAEQTETETSLVLKLLPEDPPGESGFKNDTHQAPLTTGLWDTYSYLADKALEQWFEKNPLRKDASSGKAVLEETISGFAQKIYRRPVTAEQRERLLTDLQKAPSPEAGLRFTMKRLLMSPQFLHRGLLLEGELDQEIPVDGFEMSERLSYFLWSNMPDETLFDLAKKGSLTQREELVRQVDRLVQDKRFESFVETFATEWLSLDGIDIFSKRQVPLAVALKAQPVRFIEYLIRENRPIIELVDSSVTFANPLIGNHYGKDRIQIASYRKEKGIELEIIPLSRIQISNTKQRGGLLTMPGILGMNRGPILRGTWMLEKILGVHLPEPPADVGQVEARIPGKELTFRERFELHRRNPTCAVCHNKIDPLGFALQRYDDDGNYIAAGKESNRGRGRKSDYSQDDAIDTSGRLPSGETFSDFSELKRILREQKRFDIVRNITERMLAYALCRKLEIYDQPTVTAITNKLIQTNGGWKDLITEVVMSLPFQKTVIASAES